MSEENVHITSMTELGPGGLPGTFTLYRFWHYRELLYVGKTTNPPARMKQHRADKSWWLEVTHQTMEHFDNSMALHKAESIAILAEKPRYNVAMPVWIIDEAKALETAKHVRQRWGIPDPNEYSKPRELEALLVRFELRWGDPLEVVRRLQDSLEDRFQRFIEENGRFLDNQGELTDRLDSGAVIIDGKKFQDKGRSKRGANWGRRR